LVTWHENEKAAEQSNYDCRVQLQLQRCHAVGEALLDSAVWQGVSEALVYGADCKFAAQQQVVCSGL
jgi:hypothetical protein